ncbi:SCO2400 family protein [Streptomyces sp. YPW6]|uniref:SCO2400 family protein n=1 Tax=Streptomyces sp. YPW6 TaxID=2840373 RepID=UPI003D702759
MDYCHPCRRHLNGALACAGCGTPAEALGPCAMPAATGPAPEGLHGPAAPADGADRHRRTRRDARREAARSPAAAPHAGPAPAPGDGLAAVTGGAAGPCCSGPSGCSWPRAP